MGTQPLRVGARSKQPECSNPFADASLIRRLHREGGQAGEQLLLTGTPGHLHLGDDSRPPSAELLVDRLQVRTYCSLEPGAPVASRHSHEDELRRIREAQSDRWERLQEDLDAVHQRGQRRSAVKVWPTVKEWMAAAIEAICNWSWAEDPNRARVIATAQDFGWCCAAIEAARREMFVPPGITLPDVPPVLRIEEVLGVSSTPPCETGGYRPRTEHEVRTWARFDEVFLSPGRGRLTDAQLLPTVRAAELGLHVVGFSGRGPQKAR